MASNSIPSKGLYLDWCSHEAAKFAVEHWHYSKVMPAYKKVKIGVWEDGEFIGAILFSMGATRKLVQPYRLAPEQGCELTRVALRKHTASVTRMVAIALRMLRRASPGTRLVVSFADPAHGHVGAIYQGGGWIYTGKSTSANEYLYRGKRYHGRSFRSSFPGMEHSPDVQTVKGSSKYRYLMPLDSEMREKIEKLRKPYPKRVKMDAVSAPHQSADESDPPAPTQE